ncbi:MULTISPECIES: amino acid adenylation domain-containing protein [unclassified Micromonospora]|uniref:amino acid adenylation domain-containing protein n=1 Tax=unclassified Micromonospora TaxID=2617518 RepID=UPI003629A11A
MPDGPRPISAAQRGIWTWHQLEPDGAVFNIAEYVEIRGAVDVDRLVEAIRRAVADTAAVQARFVDGDDVLLADAPCPAAPVDVVDVRAGSDPMGAALAWMNDDLDTPVDLTRDPLFRHAVLTVAGDRHLWYHRVHHIALDGFGLALVARRVAEIYTALVAGHPVPPSPFADPALLDGEETRYTASTAYADDRAYWTTYCAALGEPATLAAGRPPPVAADRGARHGVRRTAGVPARTIEALKRAAAGAKVAWTDVFTGAFATYLSRMTGATDIVLALPVMLRVGSVALRIPCMTLNVVPLRVRVDGDDGISTVARRVAGAIRAGRPHHRYRYEQLRRDLRLVGADQRLFGPAVNIMPFDYGLRFAGHRASVHNLAAGPVDDLMIGLFDRADGTGIRVTLDANPRRYAPDEVELHLRRFLKFLDRWLDADGAAARDVDLLLTGEREALLRFGGAAAHRAPEETVPALFEEQAARTPSAVALVATTGDGALARLSFADLNVRANRLARLLVRRGAGPGSFVALLLPRTDALLVALLATLKSGAAYVPVDPDLPAARIGYLLSDAGPAVTVTDRDRLAQAGLDAGDCVLVDSTRTVATLAAESGGDLTDDERPRPLTPTDPLCLIYTSGSTGAPKGVVLEHRGMTNLYRHHRAHLIDPETAAQGGRRMRAALTAALSFDTSWEGLFWLIAGHELHLLGDDARYDPDQVVRYVDQHRLDFLDVTPTYAEELLRAGLLSTGRHRPAVMALGGEATSAQLWTTLRGTAGVRSYNLYGPTECTVDALWCRLADSPTPIIGRPVTNGSAHILDEHGNLLPPGAVGELFLGGVPVARGYHRRPELTAERFVPGTAGLPGIRLYRTGDLARRRPDGAVEFLGRSDDQVKVRGLRIELGEIEDALRRHPAVAQAAAAVRADHRLGDRLVGYVVPAAGTPPTPAELRVHLGGVLPAYMVPAAYVVLPALPRNPNGKLDRRLLPPPPPSADAAGREPRGRWEHRLCALVGELLDQPRVGPDDDFFALGGHSLTAARLIRQIRYRYGRELSVRAVFRSPTLAALARALDDDHGTRDHGATATDLERDACLDPAVTVAPRPAVQVREAETILLTGATGFVGSHLLHELLAHTDARVVCLVRAPDHARARERIHQALRDNRIPATTSDDGRIEAVAGDLALSGLGLTDRRRAELGARLTTVVHNGAQVNHLDSYHRLRAANVAGTVEIVRLAAGRSVPLHYVSTCDVAVGADAATAVADESCLAGPAQASGNGYVASKWVGERLVRAAAGRGLAVTVYRPSRVGGHSTSGVTSTRDAWWSLIRAVVRLGSYPDPATGGPAGVDLVPVDHVTAAIRLLARRPASAGATYHLTSPAVTSTEDVIDALVAYGHALRKVPADRWRRELRAAADRAALTGDYSLAVLSEHPLSHTAPAAPIRFTRAATDAALAGTAIPAASVDGSYLLRCVDQLTGVGFLPPPDRQPSGRDGT